MVKPLVHNVKKAVSKKEIKEDFLATILSSKYLSTYLIAGILLLTLLVYSNSLQNGFTNWDDDLNITKNKDVQNLSFGTLKNFFTTFYINLYHPFTNLSFAIEYKLFGLNPHAFHTTNLILHLINILLVFILIQKITKKKLLAGFVAIITAIHPTHVESVAWITERKDLLYAFFLLVAVILYVIYLQGETKKKYLLFVVFILFICSVLSKPTAVILPIFLILFDYYLNRKIAKNIILEKIPFFIVSLIFGILAVYPQPSLPQSFNILDKIFIAAYSLSFYVIYFFAPLKLSAIHPIPLKSGVFLPFEYYVSVLFVIIIIVALYKNKISRKETLFGSFFFLIGICLVLNVYAVGNTVVSERYTYLPYIGLAFLTGSFYEGLTNNQNKIALFFKNYSKPILFIFLFWFSYLCYQQNSVWKDSDSLWSDVIEKNETDYFAYYNRASTRLAVSDYKGALEDFNMTIKYNPNEAGSFTNRGLTKYFLKDYKGAVEDYNIAIKLNQKSAELYVNRANAKDYLFDYKGAVEDYTKAIAMNPGNPDFYRYRGKSKEYLKDFDSALADYDSALIYDGNHIQSYINKGNLKETIQDFEGAVLDYENVLKINPKKVEIYNSLGNLKLRMNDRDGSLQAFSKAIEINPQYADAYVNRGNLKFDMQDQQGSINDYNAAIKINPDLGSAYFNRAMSKMSMGDLKGSLQDYDIFINLNPESALAYNNRGTVKVNMKEYKTALEDFNIAIKINPDYAEAFKNKAITEYYLDDKKAACINIQKAVSLGSVQAKLILQRICN